MIWRVESDLVAMYRERGLETFEFLCGHSFRPGGSHQQLSVQRMCVYIGRFYSEGLLYINCCFLPRNSLYWWLHSCTNFLLWLDVLVSDHLQIDPAALLVPAPQPLYKRRSGVVSVFWTVGLVSLAHLAF